MNELRELTPTRVGELRAFAAAARLLSFTQAAREVECTPSVLSRRVAALEAAVGAPLFLRTTRRMTLTARGEQLRVQCEKLERVMTELVTDLRTHGNALQGRLLVHLPRAYGRDRIAPLLAHFVTQYSQIRLEAIYEDAYVDLVAAKVDLAVRVGRLADSQLVARRIGAMRRYICASPAYLDTAPPLHEPADLKAHRCVAFSGLRSGTLWQFRRQRQRRSVRIDPVLQSNDAAAVRDALLAGVGIGIQGDYMSDPLLESGRLKQVLPAWQLEYSPVHLVWLPGADRVPAVRHLIDYLATHLGKK